MGVGGGGGRDDAARLEPEHVEDKALGRATHRRTSRGESASESSRLQRGDLQVSQFCHHQHWGAYNFPISKGTSFEVHRPLESGPGPAIGIGPSSILAITSTRPPLLAELMGSSAVHLVAGSTTSPFFPSHSS